MTSDQIPSRARVALVGGGAGGIGTAAAAALSKSGHQVVLAGRSATTLADSAVRLGGGVDHLVVDLADPAAATAAVHQVEREHGSLDVLIVNAGGPPPGRVLQINDAQWREATDLLLLGPLALLRAALPGMARRGYGRIVVVTSTAVRQPQPELAVSTVLRAAVTAAAKLASLEHAAQGITVNCVAPGATLTPRRLQILESRAAAAGISLEEAAAQDQSHIPAGRSAEPEEIAAAIAFLASEAAGYVNGTVLTVDGGRTETI